MNPTFITLLALCLCLGGCGKKKSPKPKSEVQKPGTVLWAFETGAVVESCTAIGSDGTVYVGSNDKLYAIKTENLGPAKIPWPMFGQNARHTGRVMKK